MTLVLDQFRMKKKKKERAFTEGVIKPWIYLLLQDAVDTKNAGEQIRKLTIREKGFKIVMSWLGQHLNCNGLRLDFSNCMWPLLETEHCAVREVLTSFFVFIHYVMHLRKFKAKQLHIYKVLLLLPMSNE